jgi:hypothetical protein
MNGPYNMIELARQVFILPPVLLIAEKKAEPDG